MREKETGATEKKTALKTAERDVTITFKGNIYRDSRFVEEIAEYDGRVTQGTYFDLAALNFRLSLSNRQGGIYSHHPGTIEINVDIGAGISDDGSGHGKALNVLCFKYKPKYGTDTFGEAGQFRMTVTLDNELNDELYKYLETLATHTQENDAKSANIAARDALVEAVTVIRDKRKEGVTDKMEEAKDNELLTLRTINTVCKDILQALKSG